MSLHEGHRERMRNRFLKTGFEDMEDHEALELILYYFFPRINTNAIAHRLIDTFWLFFYGVLSANPLDIQKVEGHGQKFRRAAWHHRRGRTKVFFPVQAGEAHLHCCARLQRSSARSCMAFPNECFYLFCLNSSFTLLHKERVGEGSIDSVPVYTRRIAETALRHHASHVILSP